MIWIIALALVFLCLVYLMAPLLAELSGEAPSDQDNALVEARAELARVEADVASGRLSEEAGAQSQRALERRVLGLLDAAPVDLSGSSQSGLIGVARWAVPVAIVVGTLGLYLRIGDPNYSPVPGPQSQQVASSTEGIPGEGQSLEALVVDLQARLSSDPNPPVDGYVLLARSLMTLGRFGEGLAAYEQALEVSNRDPRIAEEKSRAEAYAAARRSGMPQLDQETIDAVEALSPQQREEMIVGMVEGLALRLENEPDNVEGWIRLIRARTVLGQTEQAATDLQTALITFDGQPSAQVLLREEAAAVGIEP